ncbi:MAG: hypothetical protein IKH45_09160 [Neisseriaceae bacterium]|nr:hypothetical protein [Neisseriaceae bacterium]
MTEEENPYAPPKSTDFRLPEQEFKPTKGQKIARIVLGTLLVPLLMIIVVFLFATLLGVDYRQTLDISFFLFFVVVLVGIYFMTIVQSFLFSLTLEKYCSTIGKKIICSFIFAIIIAITAPLLVIWLGGNPTHTFLHMAIGAFMGLLPATMITALILHAHRKYYEKRFFRQPE